jgi:hypothetical protein
MKRYAANLLFQWRVVVDGDSGKRRLCEKRIIVFKARSAQAALRLAKRKGTEGAYDSENSDGNPIHFEFVGIMELIGLDPECEEEEVWYDIEEHLLPMERKERLIPPESELRAIRNEKPRFEGPARNPRR